MQAQAGVYELLLNPLTVAEVVRNLNERARNSGGTMSTMNTPASSLRLDVFWDREPIATSINGEENSSHQVAIHTGLLRDSRI
jgi:hypothetical protein